MNFFIQESSTDHAENILKDRKSWDEGGGFREEVVAEAYTTGALAMLEALHELVQESRPKNDTTPLRDAFYEYYNRTQTMKQRTTQSLTLGKRKWDAIWIEDPYSEKSELGSFWSCQLYRLEGALWIPNGGGPLQGNPQTEREAQLQLLQMASW